MDELGRGRRGAGRETDDVRLTGFVAPPPHSPHTGEGWGDRNGEGVTGMGRGGAPDEPDEPETPATGPAGRVQR